MIFKPASSLLAILGTCALLVACGGGDEPADTTGSGTTGETVADTGGETDIEVSNSLATQPMVIGDENAPVTLVEYASLTCPACAQFHANVYPTLKEDYIDTGLVKMEFREFPTAPEQLSYLGSALARCSADANGSDAYFAMVRTLFRNQQTWVSQDFQSELLSYAAQAGLSEEAFRSCIGRDEIIETINDNVRAGREQGVTGTPTFFIDGELISTSQYRTYADFLALLDEAIVEAGATPPADEEEDSAMDEAAPEQTEGAAGEETPAEEETNQ